MVKKAKQKNRLPQQATGAAGSFAIGGVLDAVIFYGPLFLLAVVPFVFLDIAGEFENNPKMALLQWGIAALVLLCLGRALAAGRFVWKYSPLDVTGALLLGWCFASLLWAQNPWFALPYLLHWTAAGLLYVMLAATERVAERLRVLLWAAAVGSGLVSCIGIAQHLWGFDAIPQIMPPASTFANRNMASQYIALCVPLAAGMLILEKHLLARVAGAAAVVLSLAYLFCTGTRSAWFGVLAVLVLLPPGLAVLSGAVRRLFTRRGLMTAGLVLLLAGGFGAALVSSGILKVDSDLRDQTYLLNKARSRTVDMRLIWWQNTLAMAKDHPVLGVGLGNFIVAYPRYHRAVQDDWTFSDEFQLARAHNDHLQVLAETGSIGFLLYAAIFATFFFLAARCFRHSDRLVRYRALVLSGGVIAFLVTACFTFPLERAMPPVLLATMLGLMAAQARTVRYECVCTILQVPAARTIAALLAVCVTIYAACSVYVLRGIVLSEKYFAIGMGLTERGMPDAAYEYLQRVRPYGKVNPRNMVMTLQLLGANYSAQSRFEDAIAVYKQAIAIHPNNINALMNLGYCYKRLEQYAEAEKYFKRFMEIMPDSFKLHNNLGAVYFHTGQLDKAEQHCREAIRLAESRRLYAVTIHTKLTYEEPYLNLARVYMAQGRLEEAVAACEDALKQNPSSTPGQQLLGIALLEQGNIERARAIFHEIDGYDPGRVDGLIAEGKRLADSGRHREALELFLQALRIDPTVLELYQHLGTANYWLEQFQMAEHYLQKAQRFGRDNATVCRLLASLAMRRGDADGAARLLEQALGHDPSNVDARCHLGIVLLRQEKTIEALGQFEQVLKIDPLNGGAHYYLGMYYKQQGLGKRSLRHLTFALQHPSKLVDAGAARRALDELQSAN